MVSTDILKLINTLLPGFLAAWIFYGLTAHPRKEMFERIVQALVFTALVTVVVYPIRETLTGVYRLTGWSIGIWEEETQLFWSMAVAAVMGLLFAGWANNSTLHHWLQDRNWRFGQRLTAGEEYTTKCWQWTKRTSYPSEWFSAFNEDKRYVILHLKDEAQRRISGWPNEWPDQPDSGHFVLLQPCWLTETNEEILLPNVKRMLVPVANVEIVEILYHPQELSSPT